jgi:hypothetical protein
VGLDPDPVDHSKPDIGDRDPGPDSKPGADSVAGPDPDEEEEAGHNHGAEHAVTQRGPGESRGSSGGDDDGAGQLKVSGGFLIGDEGEGKGAAEDKSAAEEMGRGKSVEQETDKEKGGLEKAANEDAKKMLGGEGEKKAVAEESNTGDGHDVETGLSSRLGEVGAAADARLLSGEGTADAAPCDDDGCPATGHTQSADVITPRKNASEANLSEANGGVDPAATGQGGNTQRRRLLSFEEEGAVESAVVNAGQRRVFAEREEQPKAETSSETSGVATAEVEGQLDPEAAETFRIFDKDAVEDGDDDPEWDYDDFDFDHEEDMWSDEEWRESAREAEKDFVFVDAHILCSPVSGEGLRV